MAVAMARTETQFKEVKTTGVTVNVFNTEANHAQSMDILSKNGIRPLTYKEALIHLTQNPELKEQLKGKWFLFSRRKSSSRWISHNRQHRQS